MSYPRRSFTLIELLIIVLVVSVLFCSSAMAKTVVVAQPKVDSMYPSLVEQGPATIAVGFQANGYNVVTVAGIGPGEIAAIGRANGADRVYFDIIADCDHDSNFRVFPPLRYNKGLCLLDYSVMDVQTGEVKRVKTDREHPWAVQLGDRVSPWITGAGELVGAAMASNYLFPHWNPGQGVGVTLVAISYLEGSQSTRAESVTAVTGAMIYSRDIFPGIGHWRLLGLPMMAAPLLRAKGDSEMLETMALRKAVENMATSGSTAQAPTPIATSAPASSTTQLAMKAHLAWW